jgi:hypothetical protein
MIFTQESLSALSKVVDLKNKRLDLRKDHKTVAELRQDVNGSLWGTIENAQEVRDAVNLLLKWTSALMGVYVQDNDYDVRFYFDRKTATAPKLYLQAKAKTSATWTTLDSWSLPA